MVANLKAKIWSMLEGADSLKGWGLWISIGLCGVILLSIVGVVLESVPSIANTHHQLFQLLEFFSLVIFSLEYCARLWTCTVDDETIQPAKRRFRYAMSPAMVLDLVAILPFLLPFVNLDLRVVRVFRLLRLLRIFRVSRYVGSINLLTRVFKSRKEHLIVSAGMAALVLLIASTAIYYAENEAQPEKFGTIPDCMWWGVMTLTTVGYGDAYPFTAIGKIITSLVSVAGLGLFALPTAILGSAFLEEMQKSKKQSSCPHCGKTIQE